MITINLLPVEFRRKKEMPALLSLRFGIISACLISILLWIFFSSLKGMVQADLSAALSEWKGVELKSQEADKVMLEINQDLLERQKLKDAIQANRISWAYVLNEISNLLPESVWLDQLKLQWNEKKNLEFLLKGTARPRENEPDIKVIGRYVSDVERMMEKTFELSAPPQPVPAAGAVSPLPSGYLEMETSTDQEILNDIVVTTFESWYTKKGGTGNESVRAQPKSP